MEFDPLVKLAPVEGNIFVWFAQVRGLQMFTRVNGLPEVSKRLSLLSFIIFFVFFLNVGLEGVYNGVHQVILEFVKAFNLFLFCSLSLLFAVLLKGHTAPKNSLFAIFAAFLLLLAFLIW